MDRASRPATLRWPCSRRGHPPFVPSTAAREGEHDVRSPGARSRALDRGHRGDPSHVPPVAGRRHPVAAPAEPPAAPARRRRGRRHGHRLPRGALHGPRRAVRPRAVPHRAARPTQRRRPLLVPRHRPAARGGVGGHADGHPHLRRAGARRRRRGVPPGRPGQRLLLGPGGDRQLHDPVPALAVPARRRVHVRHVPAAARPLDRPQGPAPGPPSVQRLVAPRARRRRTRGGRRAGRRARARAVRRPQGRRRLHAARRRHRRVLRPRGRLADQRPRRRRPAGRRHGRGHRLPRPHQRRAQAARLGPRGCGRRPGRRARADRHRRPPGARPPGLRPAAALRRAAGVHRPHLGDEGGLRPRSWRRWRSRCSRR